jgi:electron transfer flavoprotein alpha subunit
MEIFAVAEHTEGKLASVSVELLNLANLIKGPGKSNAILLCKNGSTLAEQLARSADKVWVIEDKALENYNPESYIDTICQMLKGKEPAVILIGDTPFGREFAPCLAVKLNAPVQTDVVGVDVSDGVSVSKYMFQGRVMIDMELAKSEFYVVTVRQKVFKEGPQVTGDIEVISVKPPTTARRSFVRYIEPEIGEVDLSTEDVLVTVGRGIGDSSKMQLAEELATLLDGVTAGSRPIIDCGWLPKDRQVGSSGKTVNPKLYVGLGVSGASQHVMGMKESELIIAINKDPEAPIFAVAQYGVIGDIHQIVPELINQLRHIKS